MKINSKQNKIFRKSKISMTLSKWAPFSKMDGNKINK